MFSSDKLAMCWPSPYSHAASVNAIVIIAKTCTSQSQVNAFIISILVGMSRYHGCKNGPVIEAETLP